jgi:phosphoenolpyruvate phosphomutase
MTVSSTLPLPEKDFKAVVMDSMIKKVGSNSLEMRWRTAVVQAVVADWNVWLDGIRLFCENGNVGVYAENAFNAVSDRCKIYPLDVKDALCNEIDTPDDLENVRGRLQANG